MDKLPLEIWWKVFDTIFEENPANLYQLRAVSSTWTTCIEQYFPWLYKKWTQACLRDIPNSFMDIMVAARFPMVALPWRNSYWKETQLPHIPRVIYQDWKNVPQLVQGEFEVTKILAVLDRCKYTWSVNACHENEFQLYPVFAINDKYLAVMHGPSEKLFHTYIYKLADLTLPIRVYQFQCRRIDFYTAENREFIIFDVISSDTDRNSTTSRSKQTVYMSEFLKNDKLLSTKLWSDHYAIVANECFAYRALHFEHYTFSNGAFEKNQQVILPKTDPLLKWAEISELRIDNYQLHVIIKMRINTPANNYDYYRNWWIFGYMIHPDSNGKLSFHPNPSKEDFLVERKEGFPWFYHRLPYETLPMNTSLYLMCDRLLTMLETIFNNYKFISIFMHGSLLIFGTANGKIFIYHFAKDEELMSASNTDTSEPQSITDFFLSEIDLNDKVKKHVVPIGVAYVNSKLRIIVLHPNNILTVDFPLTF